MRLRGVGVAGCYCYYCCCCYCCCVPFHQLYPLLLPVNPCPLTSPPRVDNKHTHQRPAHPIPRNPPTNRARVCARVLTYRTLPHTARVSIRAPADSRRACGRVALIRNMETRRNALPGNFRMIFFRNSWATRVYAGIPVSSVPKHRERPNLGFQRFQGDFGNFI